MLMADNKAMAAESTHTPGRYIHGKKLMSLMSSTELTRNLGCSVSSGNKRFKNRNGSRTIKKERTKKMRKSRPPSRNLYQYTSE